MYPITISQEELEQLPRAAFSGEITVIDALDERFDAAIRYLRRQKVIGFDSDIRDATAEERYDLLRQVEPEDLVSFGFIPELVGRLPLLVPLQSLDADALVRVLTEPKNSLIRQYKANFAMENVELEFAPEAVRAIAEKAAAKGTGARGLRAIMENLMLDLMYEVPSSSDPLEKIVITPEYVAGTGEPVYISKAAGAEVF